jgi:molybdopterin-containing oxidoreductase family iron-sulfur binding subunit
MSKRKSYEFAPAPAGAKRIWKSLEELERPEDAKLRAQAEFPTGVGTAEDGLAVSRRGFLTVATATTAAVGLSACIRRPAEEILPYAQAPEYLNPGVPMHFATVTARRGEALGLLVTSYEGRPTKIEGNPEHPASLGATDLLAQAAILDLYDPDRSNGPRQGDAPKTFADVDALLASIAQAHTVDGGAGLRLLVEPTNSPTFLRMRAALLARFPRATFHTWTPVNESNAREGARIAFGAPLVAHVDYQAARTIVALDCDFLQTEAGAVRAARRFADGRRLSSPSDEMSRLYVVEPTMTTTGANADHRLALPASRVDAYLRALAKELATAHRLPLGELVGTFEGADVSGIPPKWISVVAKELVERRGRSVVVVGARQPAHVHALAHAVNGALGSLGTVVSLTPVPDESEGDQLASIKALAEALPQTKTLLVLGGNPVLDAPADLGLAEKIRAVETSIHLGLFRDETAAACKWHVPRAHELETWGDQRASDGTVAIQQPLIAPLFGGRSDIEVLGQLAGERNWRGYHLVRATTRGALPASAQFEADWRRVLHRGVIPGTAEAPRSILPALAAIAQALGRSPAPGALGDRFEVAFAPDPKLLDGRHANNAWLLELPDPITRISWDNAALMAPKTAERLGVRNGDLIRISRGGATITAPAWKLPGTAEGSITLTLGWGRQGTGRYGKGIGFDAYPLRRSDALGFAADAEVAKAGGRVSLAQTQDHDSMEGRPIAIDATLEEYRRDPNFGVTRQPVPRILPLWREVEYRGHKWGMVIDLNACTGCGTCVIACQAENNIPTVGREMVAKGREMHWLRIDRYFVGDDPHQPDVAFQPLGCQQCEEAPCENVCPVEATAHSPEGLNDMAYNRCIGTRYCANNCPYKARRFNYLNWHTNHEASGEVPETKRMQFNPNVTVRMRGVMEKCTYCVQRIEQARIATKVAGRGLRDGDIATACQQACPSQAIVFGDLNDPESRVARANANSRHYKLLADIGTQPRTTYLGKVRNVNPEMSA